jgi:hypothetical protein
MKPFKFTGIAGAVGALERRIDGRPATGLSPVR